MALAGTRRPVGSTAAADSLSCGAAPGGGGATKPTASPRPSILRKRPDYDSIGSKACKNLTSALCNSPSPPSPKRPDSRGNSCTSTGSATLSADSSPGLLIEECDSSEAVAPSVPAVMMAPVVAAASLPDGISPRKKPRKQQLTGNEMQDAHHSSDEEEEGGKAALRPGKRVRRDLECVEEADMGPSIWPPDSTVRRVVHPSPRQRPSKHSTTGNSNRVAANNNFNSKKARLPFKIRNNNNAVLVQLPNRSPNTVNNVKSNSNTNNNNAGPESPKSNDLMDKKDEPDDKDKCCRELKRMKLYDSKHMQTNLLFNHFEQHSDFRVREDNSLHPVNNMAGQKRSMQKLEGWKIIHVGGQVSELVDVEKEVSTRLNNILESLGGRDKSTLKVINKDVDHVCELIKANVQRSKIIHDQMNEAKSNMSKLFVHKDKVAELIVKLSNKRQLRKKERRL